MLSIFLNIWEVFNDTVVWWEAKVKSGLLKIGYTPTNYNAAEEARVLHCKYLSEFEEGEKKADKSICEQLRLQKIRYYRENPERIAEHP